MTSFSILDITPAGAYCNAVKTAARSQEQERRKAPTAARKTVSLARAIGALRSLLRSTGLSRPRAV